MPSKTIEDFAYQVRDYMRSAEVVEGKNYFNPSITSGTVKDDITYTVNTDKSISANGTTSADTYIEIGKVTLPAGTYMLSGLSAAPHLYDYRLRLIDANEQAVAWDDGEGAEFTISATQELSLRFRYNNNVVVDHITIYPMICTLADWNKSHTYEPYYVPVKDRDKIKRGTFTATITGQGSLTNAQYCIIDKVCFVYLAITLTENWNGGDGNIILTTNLPKRTNIDLVFGGVYGYPTINCYSHSDGRISFHIISGSISANNVIMASICFPID